MPPIKVALSIRDRYIMHVNYIEKGKNELFYRKGKNTFTQKKHAPPTKKARV